MDHLAFYKKMQSCGMLGEQWESLVKFLASELQVNNEEEKELFLRLFILYFSLIEDGNTFMSLDPAAVETKVEEKIGKLQIQFEENNDTKGTALTEINNELKAAYRLLPKMGDLKNVIGEDRLFLIDGERLFTRKYCNAVRSIRRSIGKIFVRGSAKKSIDYSELTIELTRGQKDIVEKGYGSNLLVTGGPGTGKTTSILFLLIALLKEDSARNVYMTAPSGKAAARMKESVIHNLAKLKEEARQGEAIRKIEELEEYTIHRLLGIDLSTNGFIHNRNNPFDPQSIFVIDEASMIDICVFAALLESIPKGARVFILGDKNQLPSVECGAVFAELLQMVGSDNKVELTESQRFSNESEIYQLSEAINEGEVPAELTWSPSNTFYIRQEPVKPASGEPDPEKGKTPIYCYADTPEKTQQEMIDRITGKWYEAYYKKLKNMCSDLTEDAPEMLATITDELEKARILCANNNGVRGCRQINQRILKKNFDRKNMMSGFYPGEILMVTKNNRATDLYNGDCGVAVTFKDDDTLYVMFKKKAGLQLDEGKGTIKNRIFRISVDKTEYVFYPARMISFEEIEPAFAITIHKSQGSDYENILVILPKTPGHPLLNRQIVYTAITRTKHATYILSNQENLECASKTVLKRDTGI